MHSYYMENREKYKKEVKNYLILIQNELEEDLKIPFEKLFAEVWEVYEKDMMEYFPYLGGGKKGETRNLTGAFGYVALGVVCRSYGMTLDRWGYLITLSYRRFFKKVPKAAKLFMSKLINHPKFVLKMLRKMDAGNRKNSMEHPGSFVTETTDQDPEYPIVYNTLLCPLAEFAKKYGYLDYMPYLCNLDYVLFEEFQIPFYRNKTCSAGDGVCNFCFKPGAPVNSAWPCHGVNPDDPLK